jgi:4-hydroxy-2-oxoheptanedioate aldolase
MVESQRGLENLTEMAALPGVDYFSFGLMDLAQDLGHPGNPAHPDVQTAVNEGLARVHAAGKRVREDFMNFCWINDLLLAGARQVFNMSDGGHDFLPGVRAIERHAKHDARRRDLDDRTVQA